METPAPVTPASAPVEKKKAFAPVNPEEIKVQINAVLESSIPDGVKIQILRTLNSVEKTFKDSALMAHIIGGLVYNSATEEGKGSVILPKAVLTKYIGKVHEHGVYPIVNYAERPDEHEVSLEWPSREG